MAIPAATIAFNAKLVRPAAGEMAGRWNFVILPKIASAKLCSRGLVAIAGTLNGVGFRATLQPDGSGGHWLKLSHRLCEAAHVKTGKKVRLAITPAQQTSPRVPQALRQALAANAKARATWAEITPMARQDWVYWITSAKQAETRVRRIRNASSMLAAGKRRVCCFDRSGMYSKGIKAPNAST